MLNRAGMRFTEIKTFSQAGLADGGETALASDIISDIIIVIDEGSPHWTGYGGFLVELRFDRVTFNLKGVGAYE